MRIRKIAPVVLVAVALAACTAGREKEQMGAVAGAGLGALAGSQIGSGKGQLAAVAIGTLLGAWAGSEVGRQLDERDRLLASQAVQEAHAAPIGQTITWKNAETGHAGTVTPTREGTNNQTGAYCREYQQTVTVGGKTQEAYGTACRQPDGTWQVVQ
jgi:surface antigen